MTRAYAALALCVLLGCEGPTLFVGNFEHVELDARVVDKPVEDASLVVIDAQPRDARTADRDEPREELRWCRDSRDCINPKRPICHPIGVCVECVTDRDCMSGRCDDSRGMCKDEEKPRGMGGAGPGADPAGLERDR